MMTEQPSPEAVQYHRQGAEGTLTLRGSVDIFEAQALHAAAMNALADDKAELVILDMAERLDLSAVQIIAALHRDVQASGRQLRIAASKTLSAAAERAGWNL